MEYTLNRVERPPGMTTECLLVEGTIQLAGYDADLNIVFPGGQKAVLQWRVDGPTLDVCFHQPVDVFNDGPNMQPAEAARNRPNQHIGVVQLVIPLPPEYRIRPHVTSFDDGFCCCYVGTGGHCPTCHNTNEEANS